MMSIDNIMLGDYVQIFETDSSKRKFYTVVAMDGESGNVRIVDESGSKIETSFSNLLPVPLSATVMKRIGFERIGGTSTLTVGNVKIHIFHWSDCKLELIVYDDEQNPVIRQNVMYVSDIQHLLKQFKVKEPLVVRTPKPMADDRQLGSGLYSNGFPYVDLGLPSGTLWADMNIGANDKTDHGLYFAFGDTKVHDSSYEFRWSNYPWYDDARDTLKYYSKDGLTELYPEDDAARQVLGGSWMVPSTEQFLELLDERNCTCRYVETDGYAGQLFTSVRNGNQLFLPVCGMICCGREYGLRTDGNYWTRNRNPDDDHGAFIYTFDNCDSGHVLNNSRECGCSIRAVMSKNNKIR